MLRRHTVFAATSTSVLLHRTGCFCKASSSQLLVQRSSLATSSSSKAQQWGDWDSSDNKTTAKKSNAKDDYFRVNNNSGDNNNNANEDDESVKRTNYYDPKQFMGQRRGATIICRQKPIVKSYAEMAWAYFKPKNEVEESYIDSLQLLKLLAYLVIPVILLIWWKGSYEQYPDYWEMQTQQLQSKPINEEGGKQKYSYFDVIDSLEDKRDRAMKRAGYAAEEDPREARQNPIK